MSEHIPCKIRIIGSVGSGKTTLARKLSAKLRIPYYELDNVVWKRHVPKDIRRADEERNQLFNHMMQTNAWIIEGSHFSEWVFPSFHLADCIIFLDTNVSIRKYRIVRRYMLQLLKLEKSNYKPTFDIFKNMFVWNHGFEHQIKPKVQDLLRQYDRKSVTIRNSYDLTCFLNSFEN
ncbi:AAA family ATPase [Paenibacillus aestuarii]|uniref:AAA family ATPase n=1 Tax=Paenibacillus aestuarii TaxID=516965 RepID=A0ABW0K6K5_9BACL